MLRQFRPQASASELNVKVTCRFTGRGLPFSFFAAAKSNMALPFRLLAVPGYQASSHSGVWRMRKKRSGRSRSRRKSPVGRTPSSCCSSSRRRTHAEWDPQAIAHLERLLRILQKGVVADG